MGREEEIHSLLFRLATGQNTAVVGEPNIGKSSLLEYLAENKDCRARLGEQAARTVFASQDCHMLPGDFTPADFWRQVLGDVWDACPDETVRRVVDWAATKGEFGSYALERVLQAITRHLWRVVLLIDEFDSLLSHPNFNTAEFFGALRSLATRFTGLALVTASRLSVAEMNRHSEEINPYGSPFFNGFIEVNLKSFDDDDVDALLEGALTDTGVAFDGRDRDFLHAMTGRHPFLLQAAAGALYDAIVAGKQGDARYYQAGRTFYRQTEDHFSDFWRHLAPRARTAATILSVWPSCRDVCQARVSTWETLARWSGLERS